MATFPSLSKAESLLFDDELHKPQVKSAFEGNWAQTRPQFTRATNTFNIRFTCINVADKNTLRTFFEDNIGLDFTWNNPDDGLPYLVRFKNDILRFKNVAIGLYNTEMILEEV